MKRFIITSKKSIFAGFCIIALAIASISIYVYAATGGSSEDPIVSLSYLEKRLAELENSSNGDGSAFFKLVTIKAGKKLECFEGTELILRMGDATVFSSQKENAGLANAATGKDIQDGASVPANSLLIVSRSDGRGIKADKNMDLLVLVKGKYSIK